jgi:hypothetical protein
VSVDEQNDYSVIGSNHFVKNRDNKTKSTLMRFKLGLMLSSKKVKKNCTYDALLLSKPIKVRKHGIHIIYIYIYIYIYIWQRRLMLTNRK